MGGRSCTMRWRVGWDEARAMLMLPREPPTSTTVGGCGGVVVLVVSLVLWMEDQG